MPKVHRAIGLEDDLSIHHRRAAEAAFAARAAAQRTGAEPTLVDLIKSMTPWRDLNFNQRAVEASYAAGAELRAAYGQAANGIWVPWSLLNRDLTTASAPAVTTPRTLPVEDLLRPTTVVGAAGIRIVQSMRSGPLHIPVITSGTAAEWIGEGVAAPQSEPSFTQVTIRPSMVAAHVVVSRQLLRLAGPTIEAVIRAHLREALAEAIDAAVLNGSGIDPVPLGLLRDPNIPTIPLGTNGGQLSWSALTEVDYQAMTGARAAQLGPWVTSPTVVKKLRSTSKETGSGEPLMPEDQLFGRRVLASPHVPADLTKGTGSNLSAIVTGDWNQAVLGVWGPAVDLITDQFKHGPSGSVRITALAEVGFATLRHAAFAKIVDVSTS